ncbi:MAG TPA: YciI family protein [Polyangiaceae bacterium]|jgi:hypothetical protein|nr:YciI family protein [Polyangiaceae bacterium]
MLFMVMHKMTPDLENAVPPRPGLIQEMGKLVGEAQASGTLHNAAGLRPTSERVRLICKGGKCTPGKVPTVGEKELVAGFVMLKVPTMEKAVEWAARLGEAIVDGEIDVGPVVEAWDLGLMPKPANAPLRVLATTKADARFEGGAAPPAATTAKLDALIASMKEAGVFLAAETLKPSSRGARLRTKGTSRTWTDGPFTETKELISGFTMLHLADLDAAKAWTERYAAILGDIEVDVREAVAT